MNSVPSTLPGSNVLLFGDAGTGKTYSIRTLLECLDQVFVIFTEPGMETLSDTDPKRLHWHYIPPAAPDWSVMLSNAKKINSMSYEDLSKQKSGLETSKYTQFIELLNTCQNFVCDRTGEAFGPIDAFPNTCAVVLDSLSGLSIMAMDLVVGAKPTKSPGEWGVAQDNLDRFITRMCVNTSAHFILNAHPEKETDELTGASQIMVSTLGKKLAPKIPRFFSDVIYTERKGSTFSWSTAKLGVVSKARNLPIREGLEPSFLPLINNWKNRQFTTKE